MGVKTGFPAAVAASFFSSALSPQEFGETRGVLSSRRCAGRITNARSSPLSTWEPPSLTSSVTVRGRMSEERRKKQNKDAPSSMRTSPPALEKLGAELLFSMTSVSQRDFWSGGPLGVFAARDSGLPAGLGWPERPLIPTVEEIHPRMSPAYCWDYR